MSVTEQQVQPAAPATPQVDPQLAHLMQLGYQPTEQELKPAAAPAPPPTPTQVAPEAPPAAPTTQTPPAPAAQEAAPATEAAPVAPKFASFIKLQEAAPAWTDEAKTLFKARGIEDPDAFFNEYKSYREQVELLKKDNEAGAQLAAQFNSLDDTYKEFLRKATAGEDAFAWARTLPQADLTKEASKLDPVELVYSQCRDAYTADEWDMLRNPKNYNEADVAELRKTLPYWTKVAAPLHDQARTAIIQSRATEQQTAKERADRIQQSIAANAAYAREKHPELLPDQNKLNDFASGKMFNDRFFESDGFTPKPTAYTDLMILESWPSILQDVREAALEEGRNEARLRSTMRGPNTAPGGAGTHGDRVLTEAQKQYEQHLADLMPSSIKIVQS